MKKRVLIIILVMIFSFSLLAESSISIPKPSIKTGSRAIVIYGDTRTNHDEHRTVVKTITDIEPIAVFHSGDIIRGGSETEEQWNMFLEITKDLRNSTNFFPAFGNHEQDCVDIFFENFDYLDEQRWYSVDIEGIHFIVLDTTSETDVGTLQYNWLAEDLINVPADTDFIVAIFHHAVFTTGPHTPDEKNLMESWVPLFEEHGVDICFSGHNHSYERSYYNGIYYIVTAGGGAPLYEQARDSEHCQVYLQSYHYCSLTKMGNYLLMLAIDPNMEIIDQIMIAPDMGH